MPGADVDEPAAAGSSRSTIASIAAASAAAASAHRRRDARVLVVDQLDELERRAQVDVGEWRAALLGDGSGSVMSRRV